MHYSSFFAHDLILALGQRVCARQNPPTIENRVAEEIVEAPWSPVRCAIESRKIGAFLLTTDDGRRHDTAKQHRMDEEASGRPRHGLRRRQNEPSRCSVRHPGSLPSVDGERKRKCAASTAGHSVTNATQVAIGVSTLSASDAMSVASKNHVVDRTGQVECQSWMKRTVRDADGVLRCVRRSAWPWERICRDPRPRPREPGGSASASPSDRVS